MHPYRPRLCLAAWKEIMHFSGWLIVHGVAFNIWRRMDVFAIGRWIDATSLGFYQLASTVSELAGYDLVATLRQVIFPVYAKLADDRAQLRTNFVQSSALVFAIGAPVAIITGLVAGPFVRIFFGSNWLPSVPLIQALVVYEMLSMYGAVSTATLLALGRTKAMAIVQCGVALVAIPLILAGVHLGGLNGVAWAVVAVGFIKTAAFVSVTRQVIDCRLMPLLSPVLRSLGAIAATVGLVYAINQSLPAAPGIVMDFVRLLTCGLMGVACYCAAHLLLWRLVGKPDGPERQIMDTVLAKLRRRSKRPDSG